MPDTSVSPAPYPPQQAKKLATDSSDGRIDIDPRAILAFLGRAWRIVAVGLVLALGLAGAYLAVAPQGFQATARLTIEPNRTAAPGRHLDQMQERAFIDTQIAMLDSRELALRVVRDLGLASLAQPDAPADRPSLLQRLRGLVQPAPPAGHAEDVAAIRLTERTNVTRIGVSYLIELTHSASTAEEAARIATALVRSHMAQQAEMLRESSDRTIDAMRRETQNLWAEAEAAERAASAILARQPSAQTPGEAGAGLLLTALEVRLRAAREAAQLARERLNALEGVAIDDFPALERLAIGLGTQGAGLLGQVRSGTPAEPRTDRGPTPTGLDAEIARLRVVLRDAAGLAEDHEAALRRDLDDAIARQTALQNSHADYRSLENRARALRALADDRLRATSELSSRAADQNAVVMVTDAAVPIGPASPRRPLVIAGAAVLGIGLGGAAAMLRDILDRSLRSARGVRTMLGLQYLGTLPRRRRARPFGGGRDMASLADEDLNRGPLARSLREILIGYESRRDPSTPGMLGIISAFPREGRTPLAVHLARAMASSGQKVLLIDLDSRNPAVSRAFCSGPAQGAGEVRRDGRLGLDVLPLALRVASGSNIAALNGLRTELAGLQRAYDRIVVDLPPCSLGVEFLAVSAGIPEFILVVAAGRSSRDAVLEQVLENPSLAPRIVGAVLT